MKFHLIKNYSIVLKNIICLFTLQGLNYILPLLTLPYLTRVLGIETYGVSAIVISVMSFFQIFTDYGFNLSATRKISIHKEDKREVSKIFWSVILIKLCILIISFSILVILNETIHYFSQYKVYYYISFITVIGNTFFPIWLFQGMEEMGKLSLFSSLVKIIITLFTFILVKNESDLVIYLLIYSLSYFIIGISSFLFGIKNYKISFTKISILNLKNELKEGWHIFTSSILANILANSGVIILGTLGNTSLAGYYSVIDKLIKSIISCFSPITQALYPFISKNIHEKGENIKRELFYIGKYIVMIAIGISVLLILFNKLIINILLGDYSKLLSLIFILLAIWIVFSIINNYIGIQYLIGSGNGKWYSKSFFIVTLYNLIFYVLLLNTLSVLSIPLGILTGEILLTSLMIYYIKKYKL